MPPNPPVDAQAAFDLPNAHPARFHRVVEPDPGTPDRSKLAWLFILVFGLAVVGFQQFGALSTPAAPPTLNQAKEVQAPEKSDQVVIAARMITKLAEAMPQDPAGHKNLSNSAANPSAKPGSVEAFRDTILRAHLGGKTLWQPELQGFTAPATPWTFEGASEDVAIIKQLMEAGDGTAPGAGQSAAQAVVDDAARARLVARHGFYGQLAGLFDKPVTDPARAALLAGGTPLILLLLGLLVGLFAALVLAITCGIIAAVRLIDGKVRWRMDVPATGGSVLIETVAVFIVGFCMLKIIAMVLESVLPADKHNVIGPLTMAMQWSLIATPLWGVVRGVPWSKLRMLLGLHKGEGVLKEIGCGLFGYFAGLPLVFIAIIVSLVAVFVQSAMQTQSGGEAQAPTNPIMEFVTQGSSFELFMLFALASIWAPIVEELIFRGALFRHLRGWMPLVASAAVSAITFALMHGYPFFLLAPVMMLGFNFALMREWRGSLIAPMVMHSLHNATTLLIVVTLLRAM